MRGIWQATAILLILVPFVYDGRAQEKPWERAGNLSAGKNPVPEEARIDINRASVDELLKAPGMTPSWAGRIVRYRPYRTKLDLLDRGVVTAEVYGRIKDWIIARRVKTTAVRQPH